MALDPVTNFGYSNVATAPDPATTGTSLVVDAGEGVRFPTTGDGDFNVVVWSAGVQPNSSNAEIVRVSARSTDTFTIVREQEGSSARTIVVGDQVSLTPTKKFRDDTNTHIGSDGSDHSKVGANETALEDGWVVAGETWTYASVDDPTFTFTISGDKTGKYSAGMKIKLTQTTVKYFIITKVAYSSPNTTITMYGGTDYDLVNAAITSPYYSVVKAPQGFPLDPDKWTVTGCSGANQFSPSEDTWYNVGGSVDLPIGAWEMRVDATMQSKYNNGTGTSAGLEAALATVNNGNTGNILPNGHSWISRISPVNPRMSMAALHTVFNKTLTTKDTFYLNVYVWSLYSDGTLYKIYSVGDNVVKAVCAYL